MGSAPNCDGNGNSEMGSMATGDGAHTVKAMATKGIELFSTFHCHCHHSVNEPLL